MFRPSSSSSQSSLPSCKISFSSFSLFNLWLLFRPCGCFSLSTAHVYFLSGGLIVSVCWNQIHFHFIGTDLWIIILESLWENCVNFQRRRKCDLSCVVLAFKNKKKRFHYSHNSHPHNFYFTPHSVMILVYFDMLKEFLPFVWKMMNAEWKKAISNSSMNFIWF